MADLTMVLESVLKLSGQKDIEKGFKIVNDLKQSYKSIEIIDKRVQKISSIKVKNAKEEKKALADIVAKYRELNNLGNKTHKSMRAYFSRRATNKISHKEATFRLQDNANIEGIREALDSQIKNYTIQTKENYDKVRKIEAKEAAKRLRERIKQRNAEMKYESFFWRELAKEKLKAQKVQQKADERERQYNSKYWQMVRKEESDALKKKNKEIEGYEKDFQNRKVKFQASQENRERLRRRAEITAAFRDQESAINAASKAQENSKKTPLSKDLDYLRKKQEVSQLLSAATNTQTKKNIDDRAKAMQKETAAIKDQHMKMKNLVSEVSKLRHGFNTLGYGLGFFAAFQGFKTISNHIADAFTSSMKFNDELSRSKAIFTGLGIMDTRMSIQGIMDRGTPAQKSQLAESKEYADMLTKRLMSTSMLTGLEFDEIVAGAKSVLPDMIDKMKKSGNGNVLLKNKEMFAGLTEDFVKLGAALKMVDPAGRDLKFHLFGLQELFSGTSGSEKDKGLSIVRSLRMREGINIKEKDALPIAKAVNSGDLRKAMDLVIMRLEQAGVSTRKFSDLMANDLGLNIKGVGNAISLMFAEFTSPSHKKAIDFFMAIRTNLVRIYDHPLFQGAVKRLGDQLAKVFDKNFDGFTKWLNSLKGGDIESFGNQLITSFDYALQVGKEALNLFMEFNKGFFKEFFGNDFKNTKDLLKVMKDSAPGARSLGESFGKLAIALGKATPLIVAVLDKMAQNPQLTMTLFGGWFGGAKGAAGGAALSNWLFGNATENSIKEEKERMNQQKNLFHVPQVPAGSWDGKPVTPGSAGAPSDGAPLPKPNGTGAVVGSGPATVAFYGPVTVKADDPQGFMRQLTQMIPVG